MLEASFVIPGQSRVCRSNRGTLAAEPATGQPSEYAHLQVHPNKGKDRILMLCRPFLFVAEDTQD